MNRLQSELHRLYLVPPQARSDEPTPPSAMVDDAGRVRALVMELTRPPSWEVLSAVWQGVQAELELPAPAIAVSGTDGLQLWFSLAEAVPAAQGHAFLDSLRARFLPEVDPGRVRLMPAADASAQRPESHARPVPALQASGNWSAFLAQDLAPVFAETPWLDLPPNEEGQAALLRGLATTTPAAFDAALRRLASAAPASPPSASTPLGGDVLPPAAPTIAAQAAEDATRFLQRVVNDDSVALALRIEAAKALLQPSGGVGPRPA